MPAQTSLSRPIAPPPTAPRPTFTPRPGGASRREADGPGSRRGHGADNRSHEAGGGRLSRVWEGSLRGGLGVCVIAASAMIGAIATIVTRSQPGSVLGLAVLAGTVAAALTVQPRSGRLIFPVPALSYLVAALGTGVVYGRSADKTQIAVGAAQWIAGGFFVMVLATLLAIALTTVRWFMWRRGQRGPDPLDPLAPPGGTRGRSQRSGPGPDQGSGRAPDQRSWPRPGAGPYNFSSGA